TDIPLIQKVYLPYQPATDGIIWPYTPDENYSVKSGYHYITTTQDAEIGKPTVPVVNTWSTQSLHGSLDFSQHHMCMFIVNIMVVLTY
ncbi:hypothetical protein HID58_052055, partial [Brassica napus]